MIHGFHEHIIRRQIAVNDALTLQVAHGVADLTAPGQQRSLRHLVPVHVKELSYRAVLHESRRQYDWLFHAHARQL